MPTKTAAKKTTKKAAKKTALHSKATKKAPKKLTWDDIQEGFKELQQNNKELQQNNREIQQTNRELQELHKQTEKTLNKTIGDLGNKLGSIVEHILTPDLPQKFKKLGYSFNRIASYKYAEGVYAQIDGMLENGELAVAVEVKATLRNADIDDHLVRMEKIRQYADDHGDKRNFMGAMAAIITDEATRNYALKKGLFVIEPSGEDVKVIKPEGEPRVW